MKLSMKSIKKKKHVRNGSEGIINADTMFSVTEAYKAARTNVMFSLAGDDVCKKVIVTSATPGEGKTTSCINLAITFAQTEARVLIIDADLRKPRVFQYMGVKNGSGLSDVLGGFVKLEEVIQKSPKYGFDCITSGHIPPNPAELLASRRMAELLKSLEDSYDYILIDTPPVTVVTDAAAMAKFATGAVIVTRQKQTTHAAVKKAISVLEFADAKILGFILNGANINSYAYRSKYGYRNGYGYGYGENSSGS